MKTNYLNTFIKKTSIVALALASFTAVAQDEETTETKKFNLTGSVDAYFRANLTSINNKNVSPKTSFANQDGFALGMANTIFSYDGEKAGFVADLVFGPRGADAVFNSAGSANIVNQLYAYWNASESVTLTIGNFNTYLGYEVISPTGNFNYSTSYMFSNGPFSHTGLKADFAIDDNWSVMAAIMNATDFTDFNPNGKYTGGLQIGYSDDGGSAYLNFLYGRQSTKVTTEAIFDPTIGAITSVGGETNYVINSEDTFQVDLTTGWDLTEDFYFGFNGTYNDTDGEGFYGAAIYPQYSFSETFSLGLRTEYFAVTSGEDNVDDVSTVASTLTASVTLGNLTLKPELRFDTMSEDTGVFVDQDGESTDSLASFVLGAVYAF